jgi:hypothetical protein
VQETFRAKGYSADLMRRAEQYAIAVSPRFDELIANKFSEA